MKYILVQEKYQDKMEPGNGAVGETQLCSVRGLVLQGQAGVTQCKQGYTQNLQRPGEKAKKHEAQNKQCRFSCFFRVFFHNKNWTTTTTTTTGQDRTALSWEKTDHQPPRPVWLPTPAPLLFVCLFSVFSFCFSCASVGWPSCTVAFCNPFSFPFSLLCLFQLAWGYE